MYETAQEQAFNDYIRQVSCKRRQDNRHKAQDKRQRAQESASSPQVLKKASQHQAKKGKKGTKEIECICKYVDSLSVQSKIRCTNE